MSVKKRKLLTATLIPLEIDPVSILSLSEGVIFNTIIHNLHHTLSNRHSSSLPWTLTGISLICDPNRNKKFMQKLQKMQCVSSFITTQIYHSKLLINASGVLTTPGRHIRLPTILYKRLTGIIVCRSIDELLYLERKSTVHFLQYKLLAYEHIPTQEVINGPELLFKTVFDFELTENHDFPRQLLPIAIMSFTRQDSCHLDLSIQNFLKLDEHKIFDKSYLVTGAHIELDHSYEKQEINFEKSQLNNLSRTSSGLIENTQPSTSTLDLKYRCFIQLNRIDLSLYNVSNLNSLIKYKTNKIISKSKVKKSFTKKILKRPSLPLEYKCSISLSSIDLSMYNLHSPAINLPMDVTTDTVQNEPKNMQDVADFPELPLLDVDPIFQTDNEDPEMSLIDTSNAASEDFIIIVECTDDEDEMIESSPVLDNSSSERISNDSLPLNSQSALHLTKILIPKQILNKRHRSRETIILNTINFSIPSLAQESLIDPRLKYRLQSITKDHHWLSPCHQCLISLNLSSSTQMLWLDRRRKPLKNAILNYICDRINILIPNLIGINSNEFQKRLYKQTVFKTNCSIHLEYLLWKIKTFDNNCFFHFINLNEHFQLSPLLLR